jgi:hypothetical protein
MAITIGRAPMTIEPLPGAAVYFAEDGRLVFARWRIASDEGHIATTSTAHTRRAQMAVLDYLRERVEKDHVG